MLTTFSSNHQIIISALCILLILEYNRLKLMSVTIGNPQAIIQIFSLFYVIIPYFIISKSHIDEKILTDTIRYATMCILTYQLVTIFFVKGSLVIHKQQGVKAEYLVFFKVVIIIGITLIILTETPRRGQTVTGGLSALSYILQSTQRLLTLVVILFCTNKQFNSIAPYVVLGATIDLIHASKALVFTFYLVPILIRYYSRSLRYKIVFTITAILAITLFPITYAIKKLDLDLTLTNLSSILGLTGEILSDGRLLNLVVGRLTMIEPLSRIIYYGENTAQKLLSNFQLHNTFFPHFFNSIIPKFLTEGRLEADIGRLNGYYYGWNQAIDGSFVSASLFGELFINYGWSGIFATVLIALFHSIAHNQFLKYGQNQIIVAVHYLFIIFVVIQGLEGHFVGRLIPFLKMVITANALLLMWHIYYKTLPKKCVK